MQKTGVVILFSTYKFLSYVKVYSLLAYTCFNHGFRLLSMHRTVACIHGGMVQKFLGSIEVATECSVYVIFKSLKFLISFSLNKVNSLGNRNNHQTYRKFENTMSKIDFSDPYVKFIYEAIISFNWRVSY